MGPCQKLRTYYLLAGKEVTVMGKTMATISLDGSSPGDIVGWNEVVHREGPDPADLMVRREDDALIDQILDSLPPAFRTAVVLSDIEGLSLERMSELMLCPLETVRARVRQGHKLMKKALQAIERRGRSLSA